MTANQRRTGFRLPWTSEDEEAAGAPGNGTASTAAGATTPGRTDAVADAGGGSAPGAPAREPGKADEQDRPDAGDDRGSTQPAEPPGEFLRELVAAMRRVADEAKQAGIADARARAEERIKQLEAEAERRRAELNSRAEADIASVGEWAKAEAERIKAEAERRVAARRSELEEQLAADRARREAESRAVRERISEFERELEAFHAQLAEITDPAAFAAAAKRMPRLPAIAASAEAAGAVPHAADPAGAAAEGESITVSLTPEVHPAEEEVLAARLAELDAGLSAASGPPSVDPAAGSREAATTEMVVTGLGSFGAITSFRQALADVDGVEAVGLSLGQSGEFVFRATHRPGFDMSAAISTLEGSAAKIESRSEGGLLVKLERAR